MKRLKGGIVLTTFLIVSTVIFASGAIAVYTVFMKPEGKSTVPEFRNKTIADAVAESERLGLVVQLEQAASTMREGLVLAQSPEAGTELRKGQVIVLQVSKGGELHSVPDVKGMTLTEAQNEIKSQGFLLGDVVKIREPKVKAGEVIAQSPAAPAQVPSGKKIDLLVQDGADASGVVTVPDVNRMTEKEAREVLTAAGLKVQGVDRVYSPLLPEGLAIETRPGTGSTLRAGQGVILKLATQRRPAGYMDDKSQSSTTPNGTARRITSQQPGEQGQPETQNTERTQAREQTQTASTSTQSAQTAQTETKQEEAAQQPRTQAQTQTQPKTSQPQQPSQPAQSAGSKTARVRYIVPPLARPMNLRIEVTDPSGKRDIMNRQVKGGENINAPVTYSQECMVTIYLGGEFVWQERKN
ncbi:MAG: PASTA domain-containing protein [Synergistaceae bacterium]|nr:PASTA domain-containing protein [Synergistaceae bacterium]